MCSKSKIEQHFEQTSISYLTEKVVCCIRNMQLLMLYEETVCVCLCVCVCVNKIRNFLNFKRWTLEGYCCGKTRVIQLRSDANGS